jgi:hypothetical protein
MSEGFTYNVFVPSLDRYVRFRELSNGQFLSILKFIQNNDNTGLQTLFYELIRDLSVEDINYLELNRVDIFCILLTIRMICVGDVIELQSSADKSINSKLEVSSMIQKVCDNVSVRSDSYLDIDNNISATITLPLGLYYEDEELFLHDCIKSITCNDKTISFKDLDLPQKHEILDRVPSGLLNNVFVLLNNISEENGIITLFELINDSSGEKGSPVEINIVDNSLFEVCKFVYRENLNYMYDKQYILYSKIHLPSQDYRGLTPAEVNIYFNNYKRELSDKKNAQAQANKSGPNIGSMF